MGTLVANETRTIVQTRRGYDLAKWLMDLTISLCLLPFLLPVMAIIAVAILLDSSGPALFIQDRVGRGGRRFRIYKFRTLKIRTPEEAGLAFMKAYIRGEIGSDDSETMRVVYKPDLRGKATRVGRFLRKTSLDELPQIFNILKGEMSLVGPRPHGLWEVEEYEAWHFERLSVLPGITGLAQIRGRSSISFDRMVKCDIKYVKERSLLLDLKIFCKTVLWVLSGRGAA